LPGATERWRPIAELLNPTFLTALIAGGLLAGVPLIFASLGETIAEQSGLLNVGLEGMMLAGAFVGFLAAMGSGNIWVGLAVGGMAGLLVSIVMVVFCIRLGLDQIIVGIAITLSAEGATSLLHGTMFGSSYPRLDAVPGFRIPVLSSIPILGDSLFNQPLPVYVALVMVAFVSWLRLRTTIGLNLRAAGERPDSLDAAGVSVVMVRSRAELACGALAGVGGAYVSIVSAGTFVPFVTNGMGFIAIVIAMLGRGRPLWALIGSFLFGMSLSIATALQVVGIDIPVDVVNTLPFVSVIVILIVFARDATLPAALGLPYLRGSR
jgi:simple sugar transport system permease protein